MDIKVYNSHFIAEKYFLGSEKLSSYYLIASWLSNENIFLDNLSLNANTNAIINFLSDINCKVSFIENNNCYLKSNIYNKKNELIVDNIYDISSIYLLLPTSINLAKKVIFRLNSEIDDYLLTNYKLFSNECNFMINKKQNEIICSGSLMLDYYNFKKNESSDLIIGLIINALYLKQAISIKVNNNYINSKDIIIALEVFRQFGFDISFENDMIYVHNKRINIWDNYFIEGDYKQAMYYIALACLNGSLVAYNLFNDSKQKEILILDKLKKMGGNIRFINNDSTNYLYVSNNSLLEKGIAKQLKATDINVLDYPEMIPLIMAICCYANGTSKFYNIDKLSMKDLKSINNMIINLNKLGVDIIKYNDNFIINGKKEYSKQNINVNSFKDYHIAISLIVFAMLNKGSIIIKDIDCIANHYPDFINDLIKYSKNNSIELI